ncbi:MAG: HAD-IA family hydrolase [Actinomycetota bacterium]|nr:HAD-IA family hydrolase [Actinomycetota bacterium]
MSAIRALFFDFDGTLWDSESAVFDAYRRLYATHGEDLPAEEWALGVGTLGGFDPVADLEARLGGALQRTKGEDPGWESVVGSLDGIGLRPGVRTYIEAATARGLALGIVSSNERDWVVEHLERLGVADVWSVVLTADGDELRAKPHPDLYLDALRGVDAAPEEAVAVEDSPNGIAAAKSAGLFCLAVPNEVTVSLDLTAADVTADSLEDLPLERLLEMASGRP